MNQFGRRLRLSIFGESHGPGVGIVVDGVPGGTPVEPQRVQAALDSRRPGASAFVSPRAEPDRAVVQSGVRDGRATGAPIAIWVENRDVDSRPYEARGLAMRPGHADYPAWVASQGFADLRGGGHNSGRLTAPLVAAGAVAQAILDGRGIVCAAHLHAVGGMTGPAGALDAATMASRAAVSRVATGHASLEPEFLRLIETARTDGDSVGGVVEFAAEGIPVGLGAPFFDGVESQLAHLLFAIPAVTAVEFGDGFAGAARRGSEQNDAYVVEPDLDRPRIVTATNHAGGLLGGRTNGARLWGRVAIKPASSIAKPQTTVDIGTMRDTVVEVKGRHDACIAIRAVPAVRAALQLVLADFILDAPLGATP